MVQLQHTLIQEITTFRQVLRAADLHTTDHLLPALPTVVPTTTPRRAVVPATLPLLTTAGPHTVLRQATVALPIALHQAAAALPTAVLQAAAAPLTAVLQVPLVVPPALLTAADIPAGGDKRET